MTRSVTAGSVFVNDRIVSVDDRIWTFQMVSVFLYTSRSNLCVCVCVLKTGDVTVHVSVVEGLNFPADSIGAYAVAVVIQLQV